MDRISQVPEFIFHHIMSFLDSPKDRVRMSVLSKHLFALTASFPILDFDEYEFWKVIKSSHISSDPNECNRYVMDSFFKYVDYTTSRYCQQNVSVHTFKLIASFQGPSEVNIADRCLESILMKGVQVLEINGQSVMNFLPPSAPKYRVSNKLLSASSLTSLTLRECELPSSLMVDAIEFKSLKHLRLELVPIDEEMIKRLTTSCPLLEELYVKYCYGLKRFCVYGVQNLKKIAFYSKHGVEIIDIEAPNLYACDLFLPASDVRDAPCMNLSSCKELRNLHLRGHLFPISKGLSDLLSSFPFLENLFLEPYKCRNLKLLSQSLRTLVLISECDLEEIDMNMPNLLLFDYRDHSQNLDSFVRRAGPLKPCMECNLDGGVNINWFEKLRQFLDRCVGFSEFKLHISEVLYSKLKEQGFIYAWKLKVIPPFELEHVELGLDNMQDLSHSVDLVDAILWCFRPQSLTLELKFHYAEVEEWSHIVKFTHEKLLQQEDEGRKNIQIELSSSSRDKKYFGDLNSLLAASPHDQQRETITFIKQEVNQEECNKRIIERFAHMEIS